MKAQNTLEELNVTLGESPETETETLDVEIADTPRVTKKNFDKYRSKLRLMDSIHNQIADTLNQKRLATYSAFFRPEDKFIPESKSNNHLALMMSIAQQANPVPTLP